MKIKEPKAMEEIHKIRVKLWEDLKTTTIEERIKKEKEIVERFIKKYNLENRVVNLVESN